MAQINSFLRQGKLLPAVQGLYSALTLTMGETLIKGEREEMGKIFSDAVARLNADSWLRKIYPLSLRYAHGEEKQLLAHLQELLQMLQEAVTADAEAAALALTEKKARVLSEGQQKLDAGQHTAALTVFSGLSSAHPDDGDLKADIGERVMKAGLYKEAAEYLNQAVILDPYVLQHYNRLGIVLRKMGRFDSAEEFYCKALSIAPDDVNLCFNLGRVYIEWGKWDKAVEYGERASSLQPDFVEGRKLADFARKKMNT
jgi:tetratricopeptide (TPR) repeat protein